MIMFVRMVIGRIAIIVIMNMNIIVISMTSTIISTPVSSATWKPWDALSRGDDALSREFEAGEMTSANRLQPNDMEWCEDFG